MFLLPACNNDDDDGTIDCNDYHWEYEGDDGPDSWASCFADCGGTSQSPIAIVGDVDPATNTALETHYADAPIELVNNGHTVQFNYEAGSTLSLNGDEFELLQFHFHTGSEHTINGTQYPMEVHLVHQNSAGNLAVVGVMFETGGENAFLKNFSDNLPAEKDATHSDAATVNVGDLIPPKGGYFTYSGSLTTPPCSEIVSWIVMKVPVEASAAQIDNFHTIMHDNYRPVQDLNSRAVTDYDCSQYHWEYEGHDGPNSWANCYSDCGGQSQSPIDLVGDAADADRTDLETHYADAPIELINNGHTVQFNHEAGSTLHLNDDDYTLLQFHFHTGSEHTINGTQYPMEVHLVHQNSAGDLAVVGVMFEEGAENTFLKNFSDDLPADKEATHSDGNTVNAGAMIPETGGYFTYSGSLTTPPCSEIVTWVVMKQPIEASAAQIDNFHTIMHDNFRPIQDLNGRTVSDYDCGDYHWGYEGHEAPDTWGGCFPDCDGQSQSPIDITGASPDPGLSALIGGYTNAPIELTNNGHTVQFNYPAGSTLTFGGDDYTLLQFHFHTGSEHTINGTQYPMEVHLVHQNSAGDLAVVGIMFVEGNANPFLSDFVDHLPVAKGDDYSSANTINAGNVFPLDLGYYNYSGSLTTPPCSEIVSWIVMKTPVDASAAQIDAFHSIIHDNYRPIQPLNGRSIGEF